MDLSVIYDFETLSINPKNGIVISLAALSFDPSRFEPNPYKYQELVDACKFIKFDAKEQVREYGRVPAKDTLDWWAQQNAEARKQLDPSDDDQSIKDIELFMSDVLYGKAGLDKVYCRGDMDNQFLKYIYEDILNKTIPYMHWKLRDTRSIIEGLSWGAALANQFIPPDITNDFIHHDPRHDIAMDVYRMQYLVKNLF